MEGGAGKLWVSGVVSVTGTPAEDDGGETGDDAGNDTEKEVVLKISVKEGKDGEKELLKGFDKDELTALAVANADGWAYLYYKGESWSAIVATELVELDALLADAGAADIWDSGSYLEFTCSDGIYTKSYPTYDDIYSKNLFVHENGSSLVPAGLAITWWSGTLDPVTEESVAASAAAAYDSGSLRFVYGISVNQYDDVHDAPAGARMPTGVLEMTVVYAEEDNPEGSVGTSKDLEEEEEEKKDGEGAGDRTEGENAEAPSFPDIAGHWAEEDILYTAEKQMMIGLPDGCFHPEMSFSRAMLTQVLWRLAGEPSAAAAPFADVKPANWFYDAVSWAAESGVVQGVGEGVFDPAGDLTREQMLVMLYRWCEQKGLDVSARGDLSGFSDEAGIHAWARDAMSWAVAEGLLQGRPDGTLDPTGTVNRAEAAAILARFSRTFLEQDEG